MPAPRNRELEDRIESLLKSPVRAKDGLAKLFCSLLGFEYVGRALSNRDKETWGEGEVARIATDQSFEILARHGDVASGGFAILYGELKPFNLSLQRTLILQLRKRFPAALFLFADRASIGAERGARVHVIHAKISGPASGDEASQRLILRRFRIGPGERYRTTAEQLALLDLSGKPGLGTLAVTELCDAAFNKEPVTKKFFNDFSAVFEKVGHDIANRHPRWSKETVEREAQTLLNRLVFLYFIQRKGWLNRERDYLVAHFYEYFRKQPRGTTYLDDFLRPLFVKLSTKGPQADIPGHDLPFLNGGLFADEYGAEQRDDDVRRHHELKVGNDTFQHVFDELLEAYNFTVREDTPLDVEVAIDPEMLGKIFESLVLQLEQSQVGGKSSRHDTGSYYTPRPIVHYLCRESLAAWLSDVAASRQSAADRSSETDGGVLPNAATNASDSSRVQQLLSLNALDGIDQSERATLDALLTPDEARSLATRLDDLRACDIAVGSGAFPVALLHELVNLARLCETRARGKDPVAADPRWLFDTKTRFIERCLYGVDLQERAIEICKLRLWLSLVVDYPLDVDVDSCERQSFRDALKKLPALPNLDFKIRRANSLVDMIRGEPVPLGRLHAGRDAQLVLNKLAAAKRDFYNADAVPEKRRLRFAIYEATAELAQIELTVARNELGLIPDPANAEKVAELDHAQKEMGAVLAEIRAARKLKAADQDDALERLRARFDDPKKPTFVWQLDFAEVFHRSAPPHPGPLPLGGGEGESPPARPAIGSASKARMTDGGSPSPGEGRGEGERSTDLALNPQPSTLNSLAGFDLLVGNPPYVRIQVLNQSAPQHVAWFKTHYDAAKKGNYDIYVVFVERSLQLLQPHGQLAFILPHKFFNAQYGEPLRELLAKGKHLRHVVHFGDQQIFPGATNYVCLLFLAKAGADDCRWVRADNLPEWLATLRAPVTALPAARLTAAEWNFAVGQSSGLFDKLQRMPVKLGDVASKLFQGLVTSADDVYLLEPLGKERSGLVRVHSNATDKDYELETAVVKHLCKGALDVRRYSIQASKRVVFPYDLNASAQSSKASLISTESFARLYPRTWDYLEENKRLLRDRESGKMRHDGWYGYVYPKSVGLFAHPKILTPSIAAAAAYASDAGGDFYFVGSGGGGGGGYGVMVRPESGLQLSYVLALLNSRLLDWMHHRISTPFRGGYFAYSRQFIEQLPIRPINFASASDRAEHDALAGLVERILSAKRADPLADTSALEQEIDQRVYRLYALTPDEINLVEEAAR